MLHGSITALCSGHAYNVREQCWTLFLPRHNLFLLQQLFPRAASHMNVEDGDVDDDEELTLDLTDAKIRR